MAGQTLYDKLWNAHEVTKRDDGSSLIYIDRHLLHEVTSPQAFEGLELANAYDELVDAVVLRSRFEADNVERAGLGLHVMPIDEYLLAALPNMPECTGIALGIDRLLMVATEQMRLEQVISFPAQLA